LEPFEMQINPNLPKQNYLFFEISVLAIFGEKAFPIKNNYF
jgi:hypothetical protein